METAKKKIGRPKSEPRTGPLVLDEMESREKTEIELSSTTARELADYTAWVEKSSSMTTAEATSTTVEYALRDLFRRDRLWQELKKSGAPGSATLTSVPGLQAKPVLPPALPPPAPTVRPAPAITGSTPTR